MGDLQKLAGITESEAGIIDECLGSGLHGALCSFPLTFRVSSSFSRSADHGSHMCGEPDLLDQLSRVRIVDPEAERLAEAPPCPIQRPAIAVAAANARDSRDPGAALVSLDDYAVSAFAFHCIHFFQRQGSRSRSIARSVSGSSSPAWTGTVV